MFLYIGAIAVVTTGSLCICYFQHICEFLKLPDIEIHIKMAIKVTITNR